MFEKSIAVAAIERLLKENYSPNYRDEDENVGNGIVLLLARINDKEQTTQSILDETVRTIHRFFDFQYISIGLKDGDGNFRYKVTSGVTEAARKALLSMSISEAEFEDQTIYPFTSVSETTKFFMSEYEPYRSDEVLTYSRPKLLSQARKHPDDMLVGDYIEFYLRNRSNEVIGYIEVGEPRSEKLPNRRSIVWLELIASLLGAVLSGRLEG